MRNMPACITLDSKTVVHCNHQLGYCGSYQSHNRLASVSVCISWMMKNLSTWWNVQNWDKIWYQFTAYWIKRQFALDDCDIREFKFGHVLSNCLAYLRPNASCWEHWLTLDQWYCLWHKCRLKNLVSVNIWSVAIFSKTTEKDCFKHGYSYSTRIIWLLLDLRGRLGNSWAFVFVLLRELRGLLQLLATLNCNLHLVYVASDTVFHEERGKICLRNAWNLLPENVQKSTSIAIFKRSLKTFLFEQIMHTAH